MFRIWGVFGSSFGPEAIASVALGLSRPLFCMLKFPFLYQPTNMAMQNQCQNLKQESRIKLL